MCLVSRVSAGYLIRAARCPGYTLHLPFSSHPRPPTPLYCCSAAKGYTYLTAAPRPCCPVFSSHVADTGFFIVDLFRCLVIAFLVLNLSRLLGLPRPSSIQLNLPRSHLPRLTFLASPSSSHLPRLPSPSGFSPPPWPRNTITHGRAALQLTSSSHGLTTSDSTSLRLPPPEPQSRRKPTFPRVLY